MYKKSGNIPVSESSVSQVSTVFREYLNSVKKEVPYTFVNPTMQG